MNGNVWRALMGFAFVVLVSLAGIIWESLSDRIAAAEDGIEVAQGQTSQNEKIIIRREALIQRVPIIEKKVEQIDRRTYRQGIVLENIADKLNVKTPPPVNEVSP